MNLKEQLEILRGEPIEERPPVEQIPCIETSDAEKLCKHPIVSVNMITYNHEPYIRQAIEGVMMQQTDFEFELIIGEDASQDKTREICFEYQKKYPDKIRVLWSEGNVHHLGGNGRRVRARSRGEFIALCEGDDYWNDPLKLQKQVDVMRQHPDVGLCFCGAKIHNEMTGEKRVWDAGAFPEGKMPGKTFFNYHLFGVWHNHHEGPEKFIMTATVLFRRSTYNTIVQQYDIFNWRLALGDTTLWLGLSSLANAYFLPDAVSVYRQNQGGVCARQGGKVVRDATIVREYYIIQFEKILEKTLLKANNYIFYHVLLQQLRLTKEKQKEFYCLLIRNFYFRSKLTSARNFSLRILWKFGCFKPWMFKWLDRYFYFRHDTIHKLILRRKIKTQSR